MHELVQTILNSEEKTALRHLIKTLSALDQRYFLRNEILQAFAEYCQNSEKPGYFFYSSSVGKLIHYTHEMIVEGESTWFLLRPRIGSQEVWRLGANMTSFEAMTPEALLDARDRLVNRSQPQILEIDFSPYYHGYPRISDPRNIGQGLGFLNRHLCTQVLTDPDYWLEVLFDVFHRRSYDGIPLLINARIDSGKQLAKQVTQALNFLNERPPSEPYEKFRFDLQELGFEPGWGNTASRVRETLELLNRLIDTPESAVLEAFVSRVPTVFRVVLVSIHGWVSQEGVLGRPETTGQVMYVLEQARHLENKLQKEIKLAGLDVLGIQPQVIILTRLIPNCEGTLCNLRLEKVEATENAWILRVPFADSNPNVTQNWISKYEIWPYLEKFALDAETELLAQFRGSPDLIIGNYSDGNLVAFLLARRLKVTQCNIAHSLEKPKHLFSNLYWHDLEDKYHFSAQYTADLIGMNSADFIITSTYQEIVGTPDTLGQYESYKCFTLPQLYHVVDGIDLFSPKFNMIPPGVNEHIFFPYNQIQDRDYTVSTRVQDLLFTRQDSQILGHLENQSKRPIFAVGALTAIDNLAGLAECFGKSQELQQSCNLIIVTDKLHPHQAKNSEEAEEIEKLHSIINEYNLHGHIRWVGMQLPITDLGEVYRVIADSQGIFVHFARFEAFGRTILEAMSSGLPTFATQFGGSLEIIEDGEDRFLLNPTDLEGTAKTILSFIDQCNAYLEHWYKISELVIQRVRNKYNWQLHTKQLLLLAKVYSFWNFVNQEIGEAKARYVETLFHLLYKPRAEKNFGTTYEKITVLSQKPRFAMDTTQNSHDFIYTDWTLVETQLKPNQIQHRETVFTIGNGYLGTRGSFEEGSTGAVPATFIHGVYDNVPLVYTELANCPDWLPLIVTVDGDRFRTERGEILSYERQLDLRRGILRRKIRWRSPHGKTIDFCFERFASRADEHVLGLRCQLTPVDFDGLIEIQGSIHGYPENQGFNHWELIDQGKTNRGAWLQLQTRNTRINLGMAVGMTVSGADAPVQVSSPPGYPTLSSVFQVSLGQTVTVDKFVTVFTSRDVDNPVKEANEKLAQLPDYEALIDAHVQAWDKAWDKSDILIEGDTKAQLAVRYNIFQLLISAPEHDEKVSIPAKTLSGFGYRGHVFWDTEIFILPFFIYTQPKLARNLLTYRYLTLNGARRKASHYGYKGAMYAWESADTGDEVTPRWLPPNDFYGEDIRIWCRDREIHISADIAYAVWYYWKATDDNEWMRDCGVEIILDTAVFSGSRVEYNTKHEQYEIRGVIGADEYHEIADNNAFTNRMVQWHLEKALFVYDWLRHTYPDRFSTLVQKLQLTPGRISRWQDIINNIRILYDPSTGLVEQSEGFFKLEDIDLAEYEPRNRSMQVILTIEEANKRQVLKQPDVLMLLYLMRQSQEFPYTQETLEKNWDYYAPRTDITYGSSLGPAIHAILASDLGKSKEAYERFMQAALVDIEDVRGNAHEGIHGASAGGVWQAVILGFGGIQFAEHQPTATPQLPPGWKRLKFKLHWRGEWHEIDLRSTPQDTMTLPDIRGVIFDLDGVLTDTAEYHYLGWQKLADEEGLPFNREANEDLRGVSRRESLLKIVGKKQYSEKQLQEMMDRKNHYYVDFIQTMTPADLLPGTIALLDELKQAGIKIALGSASKNAQTVLEKLGIVDRIDVIADGYSVQQPKPAPDLFLFAAQELGLKPEQCVVVEDAAAGIEAALAAGMLAVGLGPAERVGAAHVVLPSLAGVHWTELRDKLSSEQ